MALVEQLGEDQVSVPALKLRTRTNVGIHSSTAFQLQGISMWSNWILYQQLTPIACLGLWKLVDRTASAILFHRDSSRTRRPNGSSCFPSARPAHPAHPAHPAYPLLKPSCKCGFFNHRPEEPHPQISLLLTTSEVNELPQSLPMPKTSSSKPPNPPPNLGMAFLSCLHKVLASTIPAELWMIN
jgi:hypothetical protein